VPIAEDVPRLGDARIAPFEIALPGNEAVTLTFEMLADDRARFGEKLSVVLAPAQ
jgi:hypothetical protein